MKPALVSAGARSFREEILAERLLAAMRLLREAVEIDTNRRGGVPVLAGTRLPISQIIAEMAESSCVSEIADDYDVSADKLRDLLTGISAYLDRPAR